MAFSQILKRTQKASIPIVELFDEDNSINSTTPTLSKAAQVNPSSAQLVGAKVPYIKINGLIITNIENLIIDETGFIPTITLIFKDAKGEFGGPSFPKKNLLASIYIKSPNDNLLSLRGDYLITTIKSMSRPITDKEGGVSIGVTYLIKGELFVPRLYNNTSKSYPSMTAKDALVTVASDLGLGFVENDFTSADTMTWINMNSSPLNFIKDTANHSYAGEESFFETYISKELNLSMIDVNRQLLPLEADVMFLSSNNSLAADYNQIAKENNAVKQQSDNDTIVHHLTTDLTMINHANYIMEASLISNQGKVLNENGYKKKIYYYDHILDDEPINKFQDYFMAPINTAGASDETMLIPDNIGLDDIGVKKWMDINYGNTHGQWNAARLINNHNLNELDKIQLRAVTRGINPQTIRGMSVFTVITQRVAEYINAGMDPKQRTEIDINGLDQAAVIPDLQLSGRYYVKGVKYYYDVTKEDPFYTELFLSRREWKSSKIIQ